MNQKPIQKRALQPPRPQARVIIGSSQIKRTTPAMNSTQNRNFNQPKTTTTAATTNTHSSNNSRNIGQNYNSNNSSNKEPARSNSKNTRLPPPASMISSNLRAVGKIFLIYLQFTMLIF